MRFAIAPSGGKLSEKHWRSENHAESRTEVWINVSYADISLEMKNIRILH
jgi:hypothetical protein